MTSCSIWLLRLHHLHLSHSIHLSQTQATHPNWNSRDATPMILVWGVAHAAWLTKLAYRRHHLLLVHSSHLGLQGTECSAEPKHNHLFLCTGTRSVSCDWLLILQIRRDITYQNHTKQNNIAAFPFSTTVTPPALPTSEPPPPPPWA